jgi:hypothetical protein
MDPIRDSAAWNGFLLVWRIQISNETFPDFSGSNNYNSIFGVPSYPSAKDPRIPITPEACHSIFDKVFSDCDAVCAKLVHQPRFQAIQEMDRAGISKPEWTRMSGHKGKDRKVHHRSYAHNPPSICLVQRAGGDFQNIKAFNPSHYLPTPNEQLLLDQILNQLIPDIMHHYAKVLELFDSHRSVNDRKEKRLYTIKGLLCSAVHEVQHFVLMMASPLVDPTTFQLDPNNSQSLWQLYHNEAVGGCTISPAGLYKPLVVGAIQGS